MSNMSKKKDNSIKKIVHNESEYEDDCSISEVFNEFFCSIGRDGNFDLVGTPDYSLIENNHNSIFLQPVTPNECELYIKKLPNTRQDKDCISIKILKENSSIICEVFSEIINASFLSGVFPNRLKVATVVPIFKKRG